MHRLLLWMVLWIVYASMCHASYTDIKHRLLEFSIQCPVWDVLISPKIESDMHAYNIKSSSTCTKNLFTIIYNLVEELEQQQQESITHEKTTLLDKMNKEAMDSLLDAYDDFATIYIQTRETPTIAGYMQFVHELNPLIAEDDFFQTVANTVFEIARADYLIAQAEKRHPYGTYENEQVES